MNNKKQPLHFPKKKHKLSKETTKDLQNFIVMLIAEAMFIISLAAYIGLI